MLNIKIKHNPGCPKKEYNAAFKHFHQNIRSRKKFALTNDWKNVACWEESEQREVLANKFGKSQIQLGGLWELLRQENFATFPLS